MFSRSLIALLVVVCCSSCHGFSRYRECKRVIDVVNPALGEIAELSAGDENALPVDTYSAVAERYRTLDKTLETLEAGLSSDFKQGVTTYRGHLRTAAREVDRYRETLVSRAQAGDTDPKNVANADTTLRLTRERMTKTERAYSSAVDRLRALCAPQN